MFKQIAWGILIAVSLLAGGAWADEALDKELISEVSKSWPHYPDKTKVEALIAKGADVNAKDDRGDTPLHTAAGGRHKDVAAMLIAKGADVNAKNNYGKTPLHRCVAKGMAELLITKGADVNAKDINGSTPLHTAAYGLADEKLDIAALLIAKGADMNAEDKKGNTPLYAAVWSLSNERKKDMVGLLIANGADGHTILPKFDQAADVLQIDAKDAQEMKAMLLASTVKSIEKQAGGDIQKLLTQYKGHIDDDVLRKSIIHLALKQHLAIPSEAEAAAGRAAYIFKNAKSADDTLSSAKEYLTAIEAAPWVANYYYNLCTVLEKTPYTQQALHACKLYLVAAPNAVDAGDMQQRIGGLQYAADRGKAQMKQRTRYIKSGGLDDLYRFGGISGTISGKNIALKLAVDWWAAPPKYQIVEACFESEGAYNSPYDLVSTDRWINTCKPDVNMHLVIKPEGEGFVELSDASGSSLRATLNELFSAKQKTMAQAVIFSASDYQSNGSRPGYDVLRKRFYVTYLQGGLDDKHSGYAMYESDCNGSLLKQDPRALPDDFVPAEISRNGNNFGRFHPEVEMFYAQPIIDICAHQFASKTGYHFGEME